MLATADGSLEEYVAIEFNRARLALGRAPRRLLTAGSTEMLRRERWLARRLRTLTSRYRQVVHLDGWEHLVPRQDGTGLWSALVDLQPRRLLLDEADELVT